MISRNVMTSFQFLENTMKGLILAAVAAVCFVSLPVSANTETKTTTTTTVTPMTPAECKKAMADCVGPDAEKCKKDLVDNRGCAPEVK
jgi:hypothetical protein